MTTPETRTNPRLLEDLEVLSMGMVSYYQFLKKKGKPK
jgi:hypothetical protein